MFAFQLGDQSELRLIEDRHSEQLFALVQENHDRLAVWVPWIDQVATLEGTRRFVNQRLQRMADNNGWTAGIWVQGELAGEIGFDHFDWKNSCTEIGYWIGSRFERKGLVTIACRAMVDHAFGELGLNRVQIRCGMENTRSRAIPEKLGFQYEGTLRKIERLSDRFVDLVVYGMLAEEWNQQVEQTNIPDKLAAR